MAHNGRLNHIWRDKRLSKRVKLKIYATFIISILVWGLGAWKLDRKLQGSLVAWNARMLSTANGTASEDYGKAISEQTHAPDFDLVAKLKAWWLRWLGHVLRMPEASLLRRVVVWHGTTDLLEGSIFDDARRSTPRWRSWRSWRATTSPSWASGAARNGVWPWRSCSGAAALGWPA
jgi:hypothetical protein